MSDISNEHCQPFGYPEPNRANAILGLSAWFGLSSAILFLAANVKSTEQDVGYIYLVFTFGCGLIVLLCRFRPLLVVRVPGSAVFMLAFIVYFLARLLVDFGELEQVKSYAFSTTGGLIFGYLFGALASLFAATISMRPSRSVGSLLPIMAFMIGVACVTLDALVVLLGNVRTDFFLIDSESLSYQRRGNFIIMMVLLVSVMLTLLRSQGPSRGVLRRVMKASSFVSYSVLVGTLLLSAQIVGSNTGFVVTLALFTIAMAWSWLPKSMRLRMRVSCGHQRTGLSGIVRIAFPRLAANFLIIAAGLAIVAVAGLVVTGVTLEQFRIFGFSERTVGGGSLSGRIAILMANFDDQFAISPVLGNMRADVISGQAGSYAHSLVSLLSHLGIVGALLFVMFIVAAYRELNRSLRSRTAFCNAEIILFNILILAAIVGFALVGTFFTWMPLWFALGFLHPPLRIDPPRFAVGRTKGPA